MNAIIGYLRNYAQSVNRPVFLLTTLLTAILIVCNYTIGIEQRIFALTSYSLRFAGFFLLYAFVFSAAWLLQSVFSEKNTFNTRFFYILLLAGPAIFAAKVTFDWASLAVSKNLLPPWNQYWNKTLHWPFKCLLVLLTVIILWKWGRYSRPVAGMQLQGFNINPYLLLLLAMVPLIALAATRADFLHTYPKVQRIDFLNEYIAPAWPWKLLFEVSYGIDFVTIEFFFRGFLVLAFARYAGKDAILPMAAFYCTIHFGKPLFECITSYLGGLMLGVVVYNTRSIWGGLIVHLGIAWLMELAGYIAHLYKGI